MVSPLDDRYGLLLQAANAISEPWPSENVQFNLQTGWSKNYSDLFAGDFLQILDESQILETVLKRGRAILAGRGGDGKTWLLRRLYREILARGDLPIFLDLKKWTGSDYEEWKEWTAGEVGDGADFLIRKFSGLNVGAIEIDRLPPNITKILLVDGLNEITSAVGTEVLRLLDELVRDQINTSVLVADRLVRRELPNAAKWSIGIVLPLTTLQVKEYLGEHSIVESSGLFTSPFFLDAALNGVHGIRRSSMSRGFLVKHGDVVEDDLDKIAAAAFEVYRTSRSRMFERSSFASIAGEEATRALENSKILVSSDTKRFFVHHLLHDYLAARCFAAMSEGAWTSQALSDLSFDGSSFDAVELVFEQLPSGKADQFLRQLYDWNLYAAGYALAQASDEQANVGSEMRTMIFAMLAEKRFDSVLATSQKASDALALMQLSDGRPFREAGSMAEVFTALDDVKSNEGWFNSWKALFQIPPEAKLPIEIFAEIKSPNSISGWTVANLAKRVKLDANAPNILAEWLKEGISSTVRWRIAHVLGAIPTKASLKVLLGLLDNDEEGSVRYGAVRSVIELAAKSDEDLRKDVAREIELRAKDISGQPKISGELRTCLLMSPSAVPSDWPFFVTFIVRSLFLAVDNTNERDLWRQCLAKAERLYAELPASQKRDERYLH